MSIKIMKLSLLPVFLLVLLTGCVNKNAEVTEKTNITGPLRLHPENGHYFQYKGKTLALVTSGEHYGAVINLDFDYKKYLESLSREGMNYTRIFTGTYFEPPGGAFGILNNTLGPQKGRAITPWATFTDASGKISYDLASWNDTYFERLKDFIRLADEKDIIVEVTLFSSIYNEDFWKICPQNPANNINIDHELGFREAHTLNNGKLFAFQSDFVRKIVRELNEFNNIFFEIQNEPWADRQVPAYNIVNKEDLTPNNWANKADFADEASLAWQDSIAAIIRDEENNLRKKHLIAQNYTNYRAPIPEVSEHISIINFHYAWPDAVRWNYAYGRVIGFDESGFAGAGDKVYRRQAWKFMLSGGGLFNNLDYSFFTGYEDGSGVNKAPGGGSRTLRKELKILSDFLQDFALEKMHPAQCRIVKSPGLIPYVLSDGVKTYAVYLRAVVTKHSTLQLKTGDGIFTINTLNTITGSYAEPVVIHAEKGILKIDLDIPEGELALKIIRE